MSFNIRDALVYLAIGVPTALVLTFAPPASAAPVTQPKAATRSVSTTVPSGYTRVGNTELYYRPKGNGYLDFFGHRNGTYYSLTNGGIRLAMVVKGYGPQLIYPQGTTVGNVYCSAATVEQQGEYAKVTYRITNRSSVVEDGVRFGIYMDTQVGDNNCVPIQKHLDYQGQMDALSVGKNDIKFNILFGSQTGAQYNGYGWFGSTPTTLNEYIIAGWQKETNNYMEENGSYDSCMGIWWDCTLPTNDTVEISFLVGFGDTNLESTFQFTVTTDDYWKNHWNSLTQCAITISGLYQNPSGLEGQIQYQCEGWSDYWGDLTDNVPSGTPFTKGLKVSFNSSRTINHVINFRTIDTEGNVSLLPSMVIKDVRNHTPNFPDLTYNFGEPVTHEDIQMGLPDGQYALEYANNTDVGTAQVYIKGVFPYSIGIGDVHTFKIINRTPRLDDCSISENISVTYDGLPHGLTCSVPYGYEKPVIYYEHDGLRSTDEPVEVGEYMALLSIRDGHGIEVMEPVTIGSVNIKEIDIDEDDYNAFMALTAELVARGATIPWDTTIKRSEIPSVGYPGGNEYIGVYISDGKICGLNLRDYNITGEIPSELLDFKNLEFLVLRNNRLTGNAGILAQSLPKLEDLDIRNNCFSEFYPAPTDGLSVGMSGQEIDKTIDVDLSNLDFQQVASLIPSIILYDRDAYDYDGNLKLELYDQSRTIGDEGTFDAYLTVNPSSNRPTFELRSPIFMGSKDGLMTLECTHSQSYNGGSSVPVKLKFPMGDANFNGKVEITDLQTTVNYIFTPYGWNTLFNYTAANMWEDGCLNVQDLVSITNVLTDYRPDEDEVATPQTRSRLRSLGGETGAEARVYCADGKLIIDSPVPVAAFDAIVSGASAMTLAESLAYMGFTAAIVNRDGESHIVAYSLTGAEIPAGRQTVATVSGIDCRVTYAMLSDIAANAIPCIADRRTGIDSNIAATSPTVTITGNEIALYTPKALNGCNWSIYTTSGTLLASGHCDASAGYTTLCHVPATMTVAVAVVETPTETITTKLAVTK